MTSENSAPPAAYNSWGAAFRPTLLFVTAFALNATPHEAVHALVAYRFGLSSTLYQMWVNPDAAFATTGQRVAIALAGPIFSLLVGVACWLVHQRLKQRPSGLLFLMLAIVGIYMFLGSLTGAALGGDFNIALTLLGISGAVLYAVSAAGLLALSTFMFVMGRQLTLWAPANSSRARAVLCTTVAPWLIRTLLTLLVYWPLPAFLVGPTLVGSAFWIFAVAGAALGSSRAAAGANVSSITRYDLIAAVLAVAVVRLLVNGVRFAA